jgi:hypothetical protein
MAIALVKDIGRPRLDGDRAADLGVESISLTMAVPSRRVCRSSWLASTPKLSAKTATGRRLLASARVERTSGPLPRW